MNNKRYALECQLNKLINDLVSFKERIDHHEGMINLILSEPVEYMPKFALNNARHHLAHYRNELERAEIEYYAVKKELAWYEFIDADSDFKGGRFGALEADQQRRIKIEQRIIDRKRSGIDARGNNYYIRMLKIDADRREWALFMECN